MPQRVRAPAGLHLGGNRRAFDPLGRKVAMEAVGQPVGRAVEVDDNRWKDRSLGHFVGVALDGIVGCLYAGLGAAVDIDQGEGKILGWHEKGRVDADAVRRPSTLNHRLFRKKRTISAIGALPRPP